LYFRALTPFFLSTFDAKGPEADVTKMMNDVYVAAIDGLKKLHNG